MAQAIAQVRDALGDDAIIVATREEPNGVRVTAAVEDQDFVPPVPNGHDAAPATRAQTLSAHGLDQPPPEPLPSARAADSHGEQEAAEELSPAAAIASAARDAADVATLEDPRPQTRARRPAPQSAKSQAPAPAQKTEDPVDTPERAVERIEQALERHGVPAPVRQAIQKAARAANGDAVNRLIAGLKRSCSFQPLAENAALPRAIAFVGPPGAGKSLAVAKMSASAVMNSLKPAVITTDTIRAGGIEQLAAFTRILKVPLLTAEDALSLADAVRQVGDADQILIDTSGRNPFSADDMDELAELLSLTDVEPVLTLAAGGDVLESDEIAGQFAAVGATRMIASRIDLTRRLGGMFAAVGGAGLAFSNVSNTPRVADGLPAITPGLLARLLLARPAPLSRASTPFAMEGR